MKRKLSPALALTALLVAASPQLFARGNASGTDMSSPADRTPDSAASTDSRSSADRDVNRTYDQTDDSLNKDRKSRKSKERNPNAATPATPADPAAGTPATPAIPATPSNRDSMQ